MKKKLLFIMNDLSCGGAEKALVSLLNTLDYNLFDVDLFLFKKEGLFLNQVPTEVNILPAPINYPYFDMSIGKAISKNLKTGNFKVIINRLLVGYIYRTTKTKAIAEQKSWKYLKRVMPPLNKEYDAAIGFLEKSPNYFCVDKVSAKKKIGFIHNDYNKLKMDAEIDYPYFKKLDKIITVSEECKSVLINTFPSCEGKFDIMYNIISSKTINELSKEPIIDFKPNNKGLTLISIGRLNKQKRYDLAINACKILINKKIDVYWYVLGDGEERDNLNNLIIKNNLQDRFILLGIEENPYPFLRKADMFVHTAEFEGFGIVITEAKILRKPMVITNFNIAKSHITHNENGLIAKIKPKSIAEKIEMLCENKELRTTFSKNLSTKDYGNVDEILKFYEIINN